MQLWQYCTVYSAPDDGRKGRPKHVEHTCSFLINTILPELHHVSLLYIIQHDKHQWLLLQFIVLLMMGAKGFRNIYSILVVF